MARTPRPHVPVNKDAPLAEFEKIAPAFPVFRVAAPPAPPMSVVGGSLIISLLTERPDLRDPCQKLTIRRRNVGAPPSGRG